MPIQAIEMFVFVELFLGFITGVLVLKSLHCIHKLIIHFPSLRIRNQDEFGRVMRKTNI